MRRRIFLSSLYSAPIKPSRRRKHRNAYLSLSVSFSLAVMRFRAMSHRAVIRCVYALTSSPVASPLNQGKETVSASTWTGRKSTPRALRISRPLAAIRLWRLLRASGVKLAAGI